MKKKKPKMPKPRIPTAKGTRVHKDLKKEKIRKNKWSLEEEEFFSSVLLATVGKCISKS
jgi:hypothetical protein